MLVNQIQHCVMLIREHYQVAFITSKTRLAQNSKFNYCYLVHQQAEIKITGLCQQVQKKIDIIQHLFRISKIFSVNEEYKVAPSTW